VVDASSTAATDNSAAVVHEGLVTSHDSNGDGSLVSDGSLESKRVVSGDIDVSVGAESSNRGNGVIIADTISSSVRVVSAGSKTMGSSVGEDGVHPSTIATVGGGLAINELLLRESHHGARGDMPETLHGSSSSEGPTGTASTLVLDGVNRS